MPDNNLTPENIEDAAQDAFENATGAAEDAAVEAAQASADVAADAGGALDQLASALSGDGAPAAEEAAAPFVAGDAAPVSASPFSDPNANVEPFAAANVVDAATEQIRESVDAAATRADGAFAEAAQMPYSGEPTVQMPAAQPDSAADPAYQQAYAQAQQAYTQPTQVYNPNQPVDPYAQQAAPQYQNASNPGTTPMVLGILSIPFAGLIGLILGIIGVKKAGEVTRTYGENGRAKAGKITGIIGIVLSALWLLVVLAMLVGGVALWNNDDFQQALQEEMDSTPGISIEDDDDEDVSNQIAGGYAGTDADEQAAIKAVTDELDALSNPSNLERAIITQQFKTEFESEDFSLSQWGLDAEEFTDWILNDFSYTVDGATIYGEDSGFVDLDIETRDLTEFMNIFYELGDDFVESDEYASITSQDDFYLKMGDLMREAMHRTGTSTKFVSIDVVREGNTWKCDQDSLDWAIENAFSY